MVCNKVWNKIGYNNLIRLATREKIKNYIYSKCLTFIPQIENKLDIYPILFNNYAEYESHRITNIFKEYGKPNSKRYILPAYRELKVENHEKNEAGVIDVIHRLLTDEFAIGDYKMGRPKYYEWEWNPYISEWMADELEKEKKINYNKRDIDFELGSYYNLILGTRGVYKIIENSSGNNVLEELEYLNITNGFVLYMRDWVNTFKYIPLTFEMIDGPNGIKGDIIDSINSGKFPLRPRGTCFDFCGYIDTCIKDDIWKIFFNQVEPEIRKSMERIFTSECN